MFSDHGAIGVPYRCLLPNCPSCFTDHARSRCDYGDHGDLHPPSPPIYPNLSRSQPTPSQPLPQPHPNRFTHLSQSIPNAFALAFSITRSPDHRITRSLPHLLVMQRVTTPKRRHPARMPGVSPCQVPNTNYQLPFGRTLRARMKYEIILHQPLPLSTEFTSVLLRKSAADVLPWVVLCVL